MQRKDITKGWRGWIEGVGLTDPTTDNELDFLLARTVAPNGRRLREFIENVLGLPLQLHVGLFVRLERRLGKFADRALAGAGFEPNLGVGFPDVLEDEFVGPLGPFHHHPKVELSTVDDGDFSNFLRSELFDLQADRLAIGLRRDPLGTSHEVLDPRKASVVIQFGQSKPKTDAGEQKEQTAHDCQERKWI